MSEFKELSEKEIETVDWMAKGFKLDEVAIAMGISVRTVKQNLHKAYLKLRMNRIELAVNWQNELFRIGAGEKWERQ